MCVCEREREREREREKPTDSPVGMRAKCRVSGEQLVFTRACAAFDMSESPPTSTTEKCFFSLLKKQTLTVF